MTEENKVVLTPLQELHADLTKYIQQRDIAQNNLQQYIGAIFATEKAIEKLTQADKPKNPYVAPKMTRLTPEELEEKIAKIKTKAKNKKEATA